MHFIFDLEDQKLSVNIDYYNTNGCFRSSYSPNEVCMSDLPENDHLMEKKHSLNPFEKATLLINNVISNVETVIQGKRSVIVDSLACWLASGHLLIEDVPGTGKTMLARAIAASVSEPMKRIQFTPDLLPSDILGSSIYEKETGQFKFMPGPIFTTLLVADEINRATPRTQAALLEAMAERQVTVEGKTIRLPDLFFVVATQNPDDQQGTFPLPEAQLDRFMMRLSIGYPDMSTEKKIVQQQLKNHPIEEVKPVIDSQKLRIIQEYVRRVKVSSNVLNYAAEIIQASRFHQKLSLACSTRATISLIRSAQAVALIEGYHYVKPDTLRICVLM